MSSSRMAPDFIQFCYRKSSPFSWHRRSNFLLNVRKLVLHNVLVLRPPPIKTASGHRPYHAAIFLYRHNLPWKKYTFVVASFSMLATGITALGETLSCVEIRWKFRRQQATVSQILLK